MFQFASSIEIHFHDWLGCEVASRMPPTFYPCPELVPEHPMQYTRWRVWQPI
jgi:hypothetical protein